MIHVFKDWHLDSDKYQFILRQDNPKKGDNPNANLWLDVSFHPSLAQVATFLLRRLQRELVFDDEIQDMKTFVAKANELHDEITLKFDIIAEQLIGS